MNKKGIKRNKKELRNQKTEKAKKTAKEDK